MLMPFTGQILFFSQPHLFALQLQCLKFLDVNSPNKKDVFCDSRPTHIAFCYLWLFNINPGEICNWIFVICNQGIIQSEDQTYWKLLHKNTSCRPPLESEACLFEIEQCTAHCTVWVQKWSVKPGMIKESERVLSKSCCILFDEDVIFSKETTQS